MSTAPSSGIGRARAPARARPPAPPTGPEIARWLGLIVEPGQALEIRAPAWRPPTSRRAKAIVRRFAATDLLAAAREAVKLSGQAPAVYVVMNPVDPGLVGVNDGKGARTEDITRRRWMLIDCDPRRPADTSSTDAEKAEALAVATAIRDHLRAEGWPEPILADSGNGWHLLYRIDLPTDDRELVKRCLAALAGRFSTAGAEVDRKVFDPPRLVKLYGTTSRKGEATAERPHRTSRVVEAPEPIEPVPGELLEALADSPVGAEPEPAPVPAPTRPRLHTPGDDRWPPEARAIAYLQKCEPAVSGQNGHGQAFKTACKVGPGFDLAPDVAFRLLRDVWNPTCVPPWSDKELQHKVDEAYRVEKRRGWLRDEGDRPGHPTTSGTNGSGGHAIRNRSARPSSNDGEATEGGGRQPDGYRDLSDEDLGLTRATDVKVRPVRWAWPYRLASGTMALIAGNGGLGKSQLALAIAAAVTRGSDWPDGSGRAPLGDVVVLSAEDPREDTILPRLIALGADLNRVAILRAQVTIKRPGKAPTVNPVSFQDLVYWREVFDRRPDTKLFLVDPLPSYLGKGVNDSKNSEIRAVLEPFLDNIIQPRGLVLLAISHINKSSDSKSTVHRILGSVAYSNLARNVHFVASDPDDGERRYFAQEKCNNAPPNLPSMAYRIERRVVPSDEGEIETAIPVFESQTVVIDLHQILNAQGGKAGGGRPSTTVGPLAQWLVDHLYKNQGWQRLRDIFDAAGAAGLIGEFKEDKQGKLRWSSGNQLYRAKDAVPTLDGDRAGLRIDAKKDPRNNNAASWRLAGQTEPVDDDGDSF